MTGFIYAIGDSEGRVKIGWSTNPIRRRSELSVARPGQTTVLYGFIEASRAHETELHHLLQQWWISGEWFRLEGPVAQFVELLPKPAPKPVKPIGNDVGQALRKARERLGENQAEFARRFGVAQPVLCRWEIGVKRPTAATCMLIERVLGDLDNEAAE